MEKYTVHKNVMTTNMEYKMSDLFKELRDKYGNIHEVIRNPYEELFAQKRARASELIIQEVNKLNVFSRLKFYLLLTFNRAPKWVSVIYKEDEFGIYAIKVKDKEIKV